MIVGYISDSGKPGGEVPGRHSPGLSKFSRRDHNIGGKEGSTKLEGVDRFWRDFGRGKCLTGEFGSERHCKAGVERQLSINNASLR